MPTGIYIRSDETLKGLRQRRIGIPPPNKKKISKEELENLYNVKNLTPEEIGKIYSCSDVTIRARLKEYKLLFVPYEKNCDFCKKPFKINSTNERRGRFCSEKCMDREYYLRVRRERELKDYSEKECLYCKKKFIPPMRFPQVTHCSPKCNKKHYRLINKTYFKEEHTKHYLKNREKIIKRSKDWKINNPERYKKRNKEIYQKNKEKIIKKAYEWHIDYNIKENKRRKKLGLPLIGEGFNKEMELLLYVHNVFQDYEILTHHRKTLGDWGMQGLELDIYLPELKLAFEYMGKQHYDEKNFYNLIKVNRTKETFETQLYRDRCKKRLCHLKGINLIRIKYGEDLSEQLVLSKIKYLPLEINQERLEV